MPMTLPSISRRRFISATGAAAAALLAPRLSFAAAPINPDRFALLSDTHIDADPAKINRNTNMHDNLQRVCAQLTALDRRPAAVLVDGDCAHIKGDAEDYLTLLKLLDPVRAQGMPIHLSLGNHDHRENLWKAVSWVDRNVKDVADRHLTIVSANRANWFILDSLDKTNSTPGVLGELQLKWLLSALDARKDKPALVMVHHNPDEKPRPSGLTDTAALLQMLLPRKHVKALLFGHTHNWAITQRDGLHLINLPPTAYPFSNTQPNGWVDCQLSDSSATLQLQCLAESHPEHRRKIELPWRV